MGDFCRSLLRGEVPADIGNGSDSDEVPSGKVELLLKDAQELRAVLGLALTKDGQFHEAWSVWVKASQLAAANSPPFDEGVGVYVLQAALSAAAVGSVAGDWPLRHLRTAVTLHRGAFGVDIATDGDEPQFFKQRCQREIELTTGLTLGSNARTRQHELLKQLDGMARLDVEPLSWKTLQAEILSWQVPQQADVKTCRSGKKSKPMRNPVATSPAKPKAVIVDGLRVLP